MADIKISALPGASTLDGTETIPLVQGGVTKKATASAVWAMINPSYTGTLTGGAGVVNLGSGQFVKDASGNVGLGVTPSAWGSTYKASQVMRGGFAADNSAAILSHNGYHDVSWKYIGSSVAATRYEQFNGQHQWFTAPSGTAGNAISFTQAMTLDASGNLGIGTASPDGKLTVVGNTINTVADNTYAAAFNATTGNIRITPYTAAYSSPSIIAYSAGYAGFGPLTLDASLLSLRTGGTVRATVDASGNLIQQVNTTAATLSTNGTLTFSIVDNSTLRVSVRGSDGTTRTATLALT